MLHGAFTKKVFGVVEYLGTSYRGWQYQGMGDQRSVSGVINHYLRTLVPEEKARKVTLVGASRTDAGVHAKGNAFHIEVEYAKGATPLPLKAFKLGLNSNFRKHNHPIRIVDIRNVVTDFNARSALKKIYQYKVIVGDSVFYQDQHMTIPKSIDLEKIRSAAKLMTGFLNVRSFSKKSKDNPEESKVRFIEEIKVEGSDREMRMNFLGPGFAWHQIRYMAGCLVECGLGTMSETQVTELLSGTTDKMAPLAPPQGLCLMQVFYDSKWFPQCEEDVI